MIKAIVCGIYLIKSPSARNYIGQSRNINKRWHNYDKKSTASQPLLNRSFIKYGKGSHTFTILHSLPKDVSQDIMNTYEILYMELYKNVGKGLLNSREGGSNGVLMPISIEKMRAKLKGRLSEKKGKPGTPKTDEWKLMMSEKMKGKKPNNFGIKRSLQAIEKARESNTGKKRSIEQRLAISKGSTGRPYHGKNNGKKRTPEQNLANSIAQKNRTKNIK
jgi:group I intron endonuclease